MFCIIQFNFYLIVFFNCIFLGYHWFGGGDVAMGSCAPRPDGDADISNGINKLIFGFS